MAEENEKDNLQADQLVTLKQVGKKGTQKFEINHANRLLAYQRKHNRNAWKLSDKGFEYNEKDGIIKKGTSNPS